MKKLYHALLIKEHNGKKYYELSKQLFSSLEEANFFFAEHNIFLGQELVGLHHVPVLEVPDDFIEQKPKPRVIKV